MTSIPCQCGSFINKNYAATARVGDTEGNTFHEFVCPKCGLIYREATKDVIILDGKSDNEVKSVAAQVFNEHRKTQYWNSDYR